MKYFLVTLFSILISLQIFAAENPLQAITQSSAFKADNDSSYIETGITVFGTGLTFKPTTHGTFSSSVSITIMYSIDSLNHFFTHYILTSPETIDTSGKSFNLVDLRKVKVPDEYYHIQVLIVDDATGRQVKLNDQVNATFSNSNLQLSDVQWEEYYEAGTSTTPMYKAGYVMHPHCISYFPTSMDKLIFYSELYNADKIFGSDPFLVCYSVMNANNGKLMNNLATSKKYTPATALVLFGEFNIADIPSGNYLLHLEVRNKLNQPILQKDEFFQRNNKNFIIDLSNIQAINVSKTFAEKIPVDSLSYYLKALSPTAEYYERDYITAILAKHDTTFMRQFFYNFWLKRNNTNPEAEWNGYKTLLAQVEANYSTPIHHGFETDRGRVYLQYGPPNQIEKGTHDAGTLPYEIWHYYKLASNQSNVKFIFYDAELATNDYKLIHSDALGEVKDYKWQYTIMQSFQNQEGSTDYDVTSPRDYFGSEVNDLFNH